MLSNIYLISNYKITLCYIKGELEGVKNWFLIKAKEEIVMTESEG